MSEPRMTVRDNNGQRHRVPLPPTVVTVARDGTRTTWERWSGAAYKAPGMCAATIEELAKRYEQVRWDQ